MDDDLMFDWLRSNCIWEILQCKKPFLSGLENGGCEKSGINSGTASNRYYCKETHLSGRTPSNVGRIELYNIK